MKKIFTLAAAVLASVAMMADQTNLIEGITLPDIPATSLDMADQEFKTADADGWILIEPNADVRNAGVTWFTAMAWNTTSVTISDVSSYTAPFVALNSVPCTTVRNTSRTKAIRFTGASDISFLVSSTSGSRTVYVALYSYDGTNQTAVETKEAGNAYTELLFSDLTPATDYIAYMYCNADGNAVIAEIAIKAGNAVPSTDPVASVVIAGPEAVYVGRTASYTATTDVKANSYKWFVNGEEQAGATSKNFEFTPDAEGNYAIVCKAKNDNNSDFVASAAINLVASIKQPAVQVDVTESTTWDWAKAGSATPEQTEETVPSKADEFNFADVLIDPAEGFNAAALMGIAQFANRGTYFQGTQISFNTTVPGYVAVTYSNTGGSRPYRHVEVNGTLSAEGSADQTMKNTEAFSVAAGTVTIKFYIPDADTPQARDGDVVGYSMGRISKIIFSTEPIATSINNTNANVKAVKVVRNGQLFIEKNGVVYNAQGAIVK